MLLALTTHVLLTTALTTGSAGCSLRGNEDTLNQTCGQSTAPHVAVCLGGSVRTLTHPAIQAAFLESVIHGFGGAKVTIFAYLKAIDQRGDFVANHAKSKTPAQLLADAERDELSVALRTLRIPESRRVIVRSSKPVTPPNCSGYTTRLYEAEDAIARNYSAAGDKLPPQLKKRRIGTGQVRSVCA